MNERIDLILGIIFMLFYSGHRFNTPPTNRSSTTAGRYFLALFLYCVVGLGFYIALIRFPHLLAFLAQGKPDAVPDWALKLSSPLFVALSLTVLLPKLPFVNSLDEWICRQLQNMAAIPYEVRRLSAELRKDKLQISDDEREAIRQRLDDEGFNRRDMVFEGGRGPMNLWTGLSTILFKLEDWETDRRMAGYLATSPTTLAELRRRHHSLGSKAKTCFRLLQESEAVGTTGKTHEAVERYEEDFVEQAGQLRQDVLDFIARGVLHAELTDNARLNRLRALGFSVTWERSVFTLNQMMMLFGVVCIVMLWGSVLFSNNGKSSFGAFLIRAIMISVIYSVAVACAVLPKSKWKIARVEAGDVRPVAFYLLAGLMAVVITASTSLIINSLLMRSIQGGWLRFQFSHPWLLITFSTAFMTALLVDNPRFQGVSRLQQRLLEGFIQCAVMLGVAYLTYWWLEERVVRMGFRLNDTARSPAYMMGMSAFVGLVIGYCVPTWYREAPRMRPAIHESEPSNTPVMAVPAAARQSQEALLSI